MQRLEDHATWVRTIFSHGCIHFDLHRELSDLPAVDDGAGLTDEQIAEILQRDELLQVRDFLSGVAVYWGGGDYGYLRTLPHRGIYLVDMSRRSFSTIPARDVLSLARETGESLAVHDDYLGVEHLLTSPYAVTLEREDVRSPGFKTFAAARFENRSYAMRLIDPEHAMMLDELRDPLE